MKILAILIFTTMALLGVNPINGKKLPQPTPETKCFSEENFEKVFQYIDKQLTKSKIPFYAFDDYQIYLDKEKGVLLLKKDNYTHSKIDTEMGVYSLNKSRKNNEKMVKSAHEIFCKLYQKTLGTGNIGIYLLKKFDRKKVESFAIDESTAILEEKPFIEYKDIVYYDAENHIFYLSDEKKEVLKTIINEQNGLRFQAFALVINKEIIYTGYFWLYNASLFCDWFIIDDGMLWNKGILSVRLGSSDTDVPLSIEDRRNDKRLLDVLERDGKLR